MKTGLPIAAFKGEILQSVEKNQVTIIVADTGAGKSTQVPQYLLHAGYEVVVTQPRRLAAYKVAKRTAEEYSCALGDIIGYKTRYEQKRSAHTKCLFVTDGLALVRELVGARKPGTVLVLDEVHEWNINVEVLIGYIKHLLKTDKTLKVVLMSATLESEALSKHFDDAPVINVPGRLFPIEDRSPRGDMLQDTLTLLREGRNVLVFQPGKAEIDEMAQELRAARVHAEILPLHADLSSDEQDRCFKVYSRPKCVIATNVAQTSITIEDIDAVVDSGMERRIELDSGVQGLYLKPISFADSKQRRGRGGRCRDGIYIDHCPARPDERLEFPKAEILRNLLDQTVLRLAQQGFDAAELEFFHQPDREAIREAKENLKLIGCMDGNGHVTSVGKLVAQLPIEVRYGRMLVEARKLGVLSDVLTIVAILEVGGITDRKNSAWRYLCSSERQSDLLAQLVIYKQCIGKPQKWMRENGIHTKSLAKAREIRGHIADTMRNTPLESTGDGRDIIKAITAGFIGQVFMREGFDFKHLNLNRKPADQLGYQAERHLDKDSVVNNYRTFPSLLVGIPFDLPLKNGPVLKLINMATVVSVETLEEVAPQLLKRVTGLNPRYESWQSEVVSTTEIRLGHHVIKMEVLPDPNHPEAVRLKSEHEEGLRYRGNMLGHIGYPWMETRRQQSRTSPILAVVAALAHKDSERKPQQEIQPTKETPKEEVGPAPAKLKLPQKGTVIKSLADL